MDVIAEFMAKISMVKSKNSPVMKQASCAHVGGYRSAIVDLYKSNNLKFEDEAVIGWHVRFFKWLQEACS